MQLEYYDQESQSWYLSLGTPWEIFSYDYPIDPAIGMIIFWVSSKNVIIGIDLYWIKNLPILYRKSKNTHTYFFNGNNDYSWVFKTYTNVGEFYNKDSLYGKITIRFNWECELNSITISE